MGIFAYGARARVAPAPRDAYEQLIGTDLLYGAHCVDAGPGLIGGNANTLRDRYRGLLGTAPSALARPIYQTDPPNFHSKSILSMTAGRSLVATAAANIAVLGSRPCLVVRYRFRTIVTSAAADPLTIIGLGVPAVTDTHRIIGRGVAGTHMSIGFAMGGASLVLSAATDTAPHTVAAWLDGVNANLLVDTTLYTAPSVVAIPNNTTLALGRAASGNYHFCDDNLAAALVLRAYPGATKLSQLFTLLAADY
jgi:hypothetical protein